MTTTTPGPENVATAAAVIGVLVLGWLCVTLLAGRQRLFWIPAVAGLVVAVVVTFGGVLQSSTQGLGVAFVVLVTWLATLVVLFVPSLVVSERRRS